MRETQGELFSPQQSLRSPRWQHIAVCCRGHNAPAMLVSADVTSYLQPTSTPWTVLPSSTATSRLQHNVDTR
jgi:hypothetical protein